MFHLFVFESIGTHLRKQRQFKSCKRALQGQIVRQIVQTPVVRLQLYKRHNSAFRVQRFPVQTHVNKRQKQASLTLHTIARVQKQKGSVTGTLVPYQCRTTPNVRIFPVFTQPQHIPFNVQKLGQHHDFDRTNQMSLSWFSVFQNWNWPSSSLTGGLSVFVEWNFNCR